VSPGSRTPGRGVAPRRLRAAGLLLALAVAAGGCTMGLQQVADRPGTAAVTTGGPWNSMVYGIRTDEGVALFDLGWNGRTGLDEVLAQLQATPDEVTAVFLTHSHRDHIAAWPRVRHARFYMARAEAPYFLGEKEHEGAASRVASFVSPNLPGPGEIDIRPLGVDTAVVLGMDTIRAFLVPGHTPGSTAYLVEDVVLAGDALAHTRALGFQPARRLFSQDADEAHRSLDSLWARVLPYEPQHVCTAHARCIRYQELLDDWRWTDGEARTAVAGR
jgi:glyoxylase-like metal-dependent hydrolase (beta-lactamase superfamily II)